MTNRLDLIDEALLRPGRFEVQVEIGLPDRKGRLQILKIHTEKMRKNKFMADDVDFEHLADATKNFSGAEIEGLVKYLFHQSITFQLSALLLVRLFIIETNFCLELDYVNPDAAVAMEFDATKLIEHIHEVYVNQVFADGQRFAVAFEADMLTARIANITVHNTLELAKPEVDCKLYNNSSNNNLNS